MEAVALCANEDLTTRILWKNLRGGHDGSIAMQNKERGDTRKIRRVLLEKPQLRER